MNFKNALNRVIKVWYERRIMEETVKNQKLRQLHDELTQKKIQMQQRDMMASADTHALVSGQEQQPGH